MKGTCRNVSIPSSPQRGEGARRADEGAGEAGLFSNAHAGFGFDDIISTVFRAPGHGVTVGVAE
ncbi:hypothetical protein HFO33_06075 [Rhizobium leguminosarum]|uniref:hypothetical protein n=1 Tax=Rhizobium leguminosarum TaxID=384 RepID=UPI001C975564|nr:hypothetical protein [Rhizobium leguminosarum]MBY5716159.1 hypothetical protein [Rhizobium leguminosarum]